MDCSDSSHIGMRWLGPAKDFFSNIGKFLSGKYGIRQANFSEIFVRSTTLTMADPDR